jgi:predicted extracellular nuclease
MRLTQLFLGLSLVATACRGGGDDAGDDTPDPDGPPVAGEVTIQEVQSDTMASGTVIELKGVVVTAIDALGGGSGGFFVSEPEGGAFGGVKVFGASLDQVALLAPGDLVNITGAIKHEACTEASPCGTIVFDDGAGLTEVIGETQGSLVVTKVGTGALPAPATVDAKALALLPSKAERDAEWEKYEGVLIKVINGRQLTPVVTFGSNPGKDDTEFTLSSFAHVQSALFQLPDNLAAGTCYDSITGIGDFFFNYIIAPRSEADLVDGGTGCIPMATSVADVQTAAIPPELVSLTNVVVTSTKLDTSMNMNQKGFWVSDAAQGAQNQGVLVFMRAVAIPAFVTVGARVNITAGVDEFDLGTPEVGDKVTELVVPTVTDGAGADVTPIPLVGDVNLMGDIGTAGEPFEGVLVTAEKVKVTNIAAGQGKVELTDLNGKKIIMDNEVFNFAAQDADTCYNLTGIMHVQVSDNVRTINPRSLTDMAITTGCLP